MSIVAQVETADAPVHPAGATDFAFLAGFLRQMSPAAKSIELNEETQLLASGILDSLGILQLMSFLSDELGIEIDDDDFTLDNFETIGSLIAFVRRRKS
jgi:acyl carrier protein